MGMMTMLASVRLHGRSTRHLTQDEERTLCGRWIIINDDFLSYEESRGYELCGNCKRTSVNFTHSRIAAEVDAGATRRGAVLADEGRVREVSGRIFRVAGSTDTYTIIIPSEKDLTSSCTCMAAKTHPEIMCKHQSAVYLTIGGGDDE